MEASAQPAWSPDLREVRMEDLPGEFRQVAGVIGLAAALALVQARGGSRLSVPGSIGAVHPLARMLGLPAAQALAKNFGGASILVPTSRGACRADRDRAARRDWTEGGMSLADLARRYGLAERRIRQIVSGHK